MLDSFAPVGTLALSWMLRATLIFAIAIAAARLLERRSAALRHALLTAGVIAALVFPPLSTLGVTAFIPADVATWLSGRSEAVTAPNAPIAPFQQPAIDHLNDRSPRLAPSSRSWSLWGTAAVLWLGGILLLMLRSAIGLIAAARIRRQSRPVTEQRVLAIARSIAASPPEIRVSEQILAPATLGIVQPTILLPLEACDWETERLRAILAHELAHVARRDCLTTLLVDAACAFHWINPLAWLARRRVVLERERACDDRALNAGADPTQYGLLLLDVANAAFPRSSLLAPAVISMAAPSELESRLLAIVRGDDVARGTLTRRGLAVITLASVLLGTAAASHAAQRPQPPQPPQPTQSSQQRGEPDRRGDSVAPWTSERVPLPDLTGLAARVRASALWHGPDSALVRELLAHAGTTDDTEELYRERAAWALTLAKGDRLLEPVLEALGSDDWRVKAYAAWTLGHARERRAAPALIELLEHSVWRMRAMAASALLQIGDPTALAAMTKALEDEAWQVRTPAVTFVAKHADPATARRLIEPRVRDRHLAVRRAALEALGASGRIP